MGTKNVYFNPEYQIYNYELFYEKKNESCWDKYGLFVVSFITICTSFTILFILLKIYF